MIIAPLLNVVIHNINHYTGIFLMRVWVFNLWNHPEAHIIRITHNIIIYNDPEKCVEMLRWCTPTQCVCVWTEKTRCNDRKVNNIILYKHNRYCKMLNYIFEIADIEINTLMNGIILRYEGYYYCYFFKI